MPRKKPMAQAAFSWSFGAIHLQPLPCDRAGTVSILRRGAPWGSRRGGAYQEVTLIRPFGPPYPFCPSGTFPPDRGNRPSPLEGEGLRAADSRPYKGNRNLIPHPSRATARVAPTAYPAPVPLVRKRQARERNRTSPNFPPTQAPSGAGRDRTQALLILRAGNILPTSRGNPRNGVRGKRSYGPRRSIAEP